MIDKLTYDDLIHYIKTVFEFPPEVEVKSLTELLHFKETMTDPLLFKAELTELFAYYIDSKSGRNPNIINQ